MNTSTRNIFSRAAMLLAVSLCFVSIQSAVAQQAVTERIEAPHWKAGDVYWDEEKYTECIVGDFPLVLSVPHGGRLKPEHLPDRTCGVKGVDRNTMEQAREIAKVLEKEHGVRPYIVINHLHRGKVDQNRNFKQASCGNEEVRKPWEKFHGFLDTALADAVKKHGYALFIDIHGHGHKVRRLELGYRLRSAGLREFYKDPTSEKFDISKTSFRNLPALNPNITLHDLLFGDKAFGTLMESANIPSTPSKQDPHPMEGEKFFSGGYNTVRYTGKNYPGVFGFQIESHFVGARRMEDIPVFAKAFAQNILTFMEWVKP